MLQRSLAALLIAALAAVGLLCGPSCHGEEQANPAAPPACPTPAEAFAAFQKGWKTGDGEVVSGCITGEYRDWILFAEWSEEFTPRFPGPAIKHIVSKHINEKLRDEITRRELPLRSREIVSTLVRSLDHEKGTFLELVKNLDEKSREAYLRGTLGDILIDGNRAQGILHVMDVPRYTCHFVKETQGWLYEGKSVREDKAPAGWIKKPEPPNLPKPLAAKPWTGQPPAKNASPKEAVEALFKALEENDPETAWNCISDDGRSRMLAFTHNMMVIENDYGFVSTFYLDMQKCVTLTFERASQDKPGQNRTMEDQWEDSLFAMSESIRDQKVLCSAIVKGVGENIRSTPPEKRLRLELRDVRQEGDRATGILKLEKAQPNAEETKKESEEPAREMVLAFKRSKDGWRIELPPLKQFLTPIKK